MLTVPPLGLEAGGLALVLKAGCPPGLKASCPSPGTKGQLALPWDLRPALSLYWNQRSAISPRDQRPSYPPQGLEISNCPGSQGVHIVMTFTAVMLI